MGVVFFPSRVTGFSAMSRRQMMTFIEGRHLRENSSQRAASFGPACRFTLTMTCFVSDIDPRPKPAKLVLLLHCVVPTRTWLDQRNVHRLVRKLDVVVDPLRARSRQPIDVVALRKIWFVMRPARLIAGQRAERDNPRQDYHILQFACEVQRLVRPLRAVTEIDFFVA